MRFSKSERIVSQKTIDGLFGGHDSHSTVSFPLRAVYIEKVRARGEAAVQVLLTVPKKRFKHAVDRNRVKRQLREAYRQHKTLLTDVLLADEGIALAFVWLSDKHATTPAVERRVVTLLERIARRHVDEREGRQLEAARREEETSG